MSQQLPTAPHYSPDRRWYWTGYEWKANPSLSTEERARQTSARVRERSSAWLWVLIGLAIAVVVLGPVIAFIVLLVLA